MDDELDRCAEHPFERSHLLCGSCGHAYCDECLVFPFGPRKSPLCMQCAVHAGGLRRSGGVPPVRSRKEIERINAIKSAEHLSSAPTGEVPAFVPYAFAGEGDLAADPAPRRRVLRRKAS